MKLKKFVESSTLVLALCNLDLIFLKGFVIVITKEKIKPNITIRHFPDLLYMKLNVHLNLIKIAMFRHMAKQIAAKKPETLLF